MPGKKYMSESKREIGIELRSKLRNGYHVGAIAGWAYELSTDRDANSDVQDLLYRLSFIGEPGFGDYAKEELEVLANLLVLNVDNICEKFLPMAPEHGYLFYKDKADLAIGKWFIVWLSENLSKQKLFEELALGLQLPKRFSNSSSYDWIDALEWLVHLDWIVEPNILIVHDDIPLKSSPEEQKKYFELLSDVHKAWCGDELGYDHDHEVYYAFPKRFSPEVKNLKIPI
jgi:hypothetical protein